MRTAKNESERRSFYRDPLQVTWVLRGSPKGVGEGGTPTLKRERAWVLVADWSRRSIRMAGVQAGGCVFCHHVMQGSCEATREG